MRCASISATAQAIAWERIRSDSSHRRSGSSFLESSSPTIRRFGLRITAAATTGPNSAPRPASSRPAMRVQPSRRAARSKREEQSRAIFVSSNPNFSTLKEKRDKQLLVPSQILLLLCLSLGSDGGRWSFFACCALDAGCLAAQIAQVIEARTADVALADDVDRSNRGRMQREDALDAHAETHTAHGEARAAGAALLRNHHAFKCLDAFLDLLAFAFHQAYVHLDGVAGAELGEIFAQLRFMQLLNDRIHFRCSLQTHSGGASTSKANIDYRQTRTVCLAVLGRENVVLPSGPRHVRMRAAHYRGRKPLHFFKLRAELQEQQVCSGALELGNPRRHLFRRANQPGTQAAV